MADEAPTTPPVEPPREHTPEERKAANLARARANLLPPCKPGEVRNPTGKNGRTQHAALVKWLEQPSTDPEMSRIERVWQATYLAALKGSSPDRKILIEQHGGKPKQQVQVSGGEGGPLRVVAFLPNNGRGPDDPDPDDGESGAPATAE